jgi:hypothetical protein
MLRTAAVLFGLLGLSCAWRGVALVEEVSGERYQRPPRAFESADAVVFARDKTLGARAMKHMQLLAPRLRELLGCDSKLPEIWLLDQARIQGRAGLHASGEDGDYLLIAASASGSLEYLLAHELAHWCSDACAVELPSAVEEGLADVIVLEVMPGLSEWMLEQRANDSPSEDWPLERALELDFESWGRLQRHEERELRSICFLLVLELGLENLAELRETARAQGLERVPAEWFLGLGPGAAYPRLKQRAACQGGGGV